MKLILQRRIVGSVLLLMLIAMTVWFLLDAVSEREINTDSKLVTSHIELNQPTPVETQQDPEVLTPDSIDYVPETEQAIDVTKEIVEKDKQHLAEATTDGKQTMQKNQPQWILQLASFSIFNNAKSLAEKLKEDGYQAVVKSSNNKGKKIYRVQLAPQSDIEELKQISKQLDSRFQLSSQILKHQ